MPADDIIGKNCNYKDMTFCKHTPAVSAAEENLY